MILVLIMKKAAQWWRAGACTTWILWTKGQFTSWGGLRRLHERSSYKSTQNAVQVKTYELFTSLNLHVIISDHNWPIITKNKTVDKRGHRIGVEWSLVAWYLVLEWSRKKTIASQDAWAWQRRQALDWWVCISSSAIQAELFATPNTTKNWVG